LAQLNGIHQLSDEEELILEKNLVWIFGSPRSGTTWLAHDLLQYKTLRLGEPLIGDHLSADRELGKTYVKRIEEHKDRESYFFSSKHKDVWKFFLRKLILNRIHSQFKNLNSTIIIKEPNGSMAADIISDCLPKSKIIVLIRDGRDIINSQITALSEGGYVVKREKRFEPLSGARRNTAIIRHAKRWMKLMEVLMKTYESHDEKLRLFLRYETLRSNTLAELKKIYKFLNIDIDTDSLSKIVSDNAFENLSAEKKGVGTTRQFASSGKWKENFSKSEIKTIQEIIGETLTKLNYSV
jgi:hypothetical protein